MFVIYIDYILVLGGNSDDMELKAILMMPTVLLYVKSKKHE